MFHILCLQVFYLDVTYVFAMVSNDFQAFLQVFHLSSDVCCKVTSERFKSRSGAASSSSSSAASSRYLLPAPAGHPPPPPSLLDPGDVRGGAGPRGHARPSGRSVHPEVRTLANLITKSRKIRPGVA
jgi:hypothetical protein